jgi:cullin-4
MYHFPSKKGAIPANAEIVDLSSSPPTGAGSPAKPIQQRNAVRKTAPNMHASTAPKKLMVKNFKPTRKVDPKVFLEQTWQKVDAALDTIFQQGQINFSLEELYRGVENLCRQGLARDAKERLEGKCRGYVGGVLKEQVVEMVGRKDSEVLRAAMGAWTTWNEQLVSFDFSCSYDRSAEADGCRNTSTGSFATSTARISSLDIRPSARLLSTSSARLYSNTQSLIRGS